MSENKKVSLEQLIKKKLEKDGKKNASKEIYVEALNGSITVTNPSDSQRIEFADKTKSGSYVDMMEAYEKLIYDCCPMLHSQELQKEIDVDYPYDTVRGPLTQRFYYHAMELYYLEKLNLNGHHKIG